MELELAAAARCGEDLSRIRQAGRIEGRLYPTHRGEVVGAELERHVAVLLHAHAVLTGERAAGLDARGEDLQTGFVHPRQPAHVREEQKRMQVPVPGLKT